MKFIPVSTLEVVDLPDSSPYSLASFNPNFTIPYFYIEGYYTTVSKEKELTVSVCFPLSAKEGLKNSGKKTYIYISFYHYLLKDIIN